VDLVDEHDRARIGFDLLDDLLEALFKIAAVACARQQRAHVEREHRRVLEYVRHFAMDDAAGKSFGNRRLADAGLADEQRVILLPAAQHLDGAADFRIAPDQRIDLAVLGFLVEVDAVRIQRIALLFRLVTALAVGLFLGATHRPRFRQARPLGDAMADVIHRVVARHILLLQEIGGVALALGENSDEHIRARHLFPARRLHMDHRALDDALKSCGRLGVLRAIGDQVFQLGFKISRHCPLQLVEFDVAGAHHGGCVLVVDQGQQQMLERRIFVMPFVGERQRTVQRLLETTGECRH
jgi:hypothetical protein